jgi:hypothetical protein
MQIVINHLTRMQRGFMCVAGVDLATGRHVRPVLASQLLHPTRSPFQDCHIANG